MSPTFDEVRLIVDDQVCPACSAGRLTLNLSAAGTWIASCSSCDARFAVDGDESS